MLLPMSYVMFAFGNILPPMFNPASVPTLVIFGWAFVVNVPVTKLPLTVPELANTLPEVILLVTVKLPNVPISVIFVCVPV